MNRKQRRSIGFTEPRYRKQDLISNGMNTKILNPFHSYSRPDVIVFGEEHPPRSNRLDGEPRRWQVERERRRNK